MSAILEPAPGGMAEKEAGSLTGSVGDSVPPDNAIQSSRGSKPRKTVMLSWSATDEMDVPPTNRAIAGLAKDIIACGMNVTCATDPSMYDLGAELSGTVAKYWSEPEISMVFTNYLPWPVHLRMSADEVRKYSSYPHRGMRAVFLDVDGIRITTNERLAMAPREPTERDWKAGLSTARRAACMLSDCLVAIGGRTGGYKGRMPGVAEEIKAALSSQTPVVLVGGFGGCARHVADSMGITEEECGKNWGWLDDFSYMTYDDLRNGLSLGVNAGIAGGRLGPDDRSRIIQGLDGITP